MEGLEVDEMSPPRRLEFMKEVMRAAAAEVRARLFGAFGRPVAGNPPKPSAGVARSPTSPAAGDPRSPLPGPCGHRARRPPVTFCRLLL